MDGFPGFSPQCLTVPLKMPHSGYPSRTTVPLSDVSPGDNLAPPRAEQFAKTHLHRLWEQSPLAWDLHIERRVFRVPHRPRVHEVLSRNTRSLLANFVMGEFFLPPP